MLIVLAFTAGVVVGYGVCHFGWASIWTWLTAAGVAVVGFWEQSKAFIGGLLS